MIRRDRKPEYSHFYFELCDFGESFECFYLFLNFGNRGVNLVEFFEFEEAVSYWTFVENIQSHESWRYIIILNKL